MDSLEQTTRAGAACGIGVLLIGVAVALWIVFGRFLFGVGGELTLPYLPIGAVIIVLYAYLGRAFARTRRRGFAVRSSTRGALITAVACGLLFGLTIPDITPQGLQTIISGPHEPALGIAIGVTNPSWVIMFAFTIIALVLAHQDSHGPRSEDDEDL